MSNTNENLAEQVKKWLSPQSLVWLKDQALMSENSDLYQILLTLDYLVSSREDSVRQNADIWGAWGRNSLTPTKPKWGTDREYIEYIHELLETQEEKNFDLLDTVIELEEIRDAWEEMIPGGPEAFVERLRVWDRDISLGLEGESAEDILRDILTGPIRPQSYDRLPSLD